MSKVPQKLSWITNLFVPSTAFLLWTVAANAQNDMSSPLGRYDSISEYCGAEAIPKDTISIPWIGCFYLSVGHRAIGKLANQNVEVAVDGTGREVFTVDGTPIAHVLGQQDPGKTTSPYVHLAGAGYSFCEDVSFISCPAMIAVYSRNPDRSVLFMVSECFPPAYHICATTQTGWDFEKRLQH